MVFDPRNFDPMEYDRESRGDPKRDTLKWQFTFNPVELFKKLYKLFRR